MLDDFRGDDIKIASGADGVRLLLVSGIPPSEPVAWYGPIVMNRLILTIRTVAGINQIVTGKEAENFTPGTKTEKTLEKRKDAEQHKHCRRKEGLLEQDKQCSR